MWDWLQEHKGLLFALFVLSIVSLLLTAILLPIVVVRLPAGYFLRAPRLHSRRSRTNLLWHIAKNVLGVVFVLAGIAMLVLPGQGLLTILIGLLVIDFPGKYRLERSLVARRGILRTINRIRARFGKPPLRLPAKPEEGPRPDTGGP